MVARGCLLTVVAVLAFATQMKAEERKTFAESIRPIADGAQDRSALTDAELSETMQVMVSLTMRNYPELQARIANGEIISQAEMSAKYYPLEKDFAAVQTWAQKQGLVKTQPSISRLCVFVAGTQKQVRDAFQVQLTKVVAANGKMYHSASTAPSLPAEIAGAVLGVHGLQPHLQRHVHSRKVPMAAVGSRDQNAPPYFPGEILKAYGATGVTFDGTGQTIAIVIDTFPDSADLTAFWSKTGVNQNINNVDFIQAVSGTLPKPSGEETLDAEWTSGIAAGARIRIYATKTLGDADLDSGYNNIINDIPTQPSLHQVSLSFGSGELESSTSTMKSDSQLFATMAATGGITVFCSSGDEGSATNSRGQAHTGTIQVESPANDVNVTAVGGTTINLSGSGVITSETAWSDTGGGVGTIFSRPSWQVGSSVPSGSFKFVPDLASGADPNTGALVIQGGQSQTIGGTSWSSPTWAGLCAIINQARAKAGQTPLGLMGPKIYPLLGTSAFRDITSGSNGPNGQWDAGTGFDLCTGLGTPNLSVLIGKLSVPPPITFTSGPTAAPSSATPGQTITFTAAATSTTKLPVTITWDFGDGSPTVTGSSVTHSYSAGGTYQVTVTGSDGINTSPSTISVQVAQILSVIKSALKFNLKTQSDSYSFSAPITLPASFAPEGKAINVTIGGYTNSVTLSKAGKGGLSTDSVKLAGRISKGVFTSTAATLTVSASRQDLFDSFSQFGFTNADGVDGGPFTITATIVIDGTSYLVKPSYLYTAKQGISGKGTQQ